MNDDELKKYEKKLNKLIDELNNEKNNLMYLLMNIDIKDINILSYHYKFINLNNEIDYIKQQIFNLKY